MSTQSTWPSCVIAQLGREPIVGDWVIPCCLEDLAQIRSSDDLDSFRRLIADCYAGEVFYATLDAALAWAIPDIKGHLTDDEIEAHVARLRATAITGSDRR